MSDMRNPTNTIITTPTGPGQILVSDGGGVASWNSVVDLNADMIEFFELILVLLGVDLTFEEFKHMSKDERLSLVRDLKINKILK
jgi:hypothetical protein